MNKTQEILMSQYQPNKLEEIKKKKKARIDSIIESAKMLQSLLNEQKASNAKPSTNESIDDILARLGCL